MKRIQLLICYILWGWQYFLWWLSPRSYCTTRAKVIYLKTWIRWFGTVQ